MMSYFGILLFLFGVLRDAAALKCYSCNNIADINGCQNLVTCDTRQSCFTRSQTTGQNQTFSMGCTDNSNCGKIPVYDGISSSSWESNCDECCGKDECNKRLCKNRQPPPCEDTVDDCSYWNKKFDICNTIHEAKVICRKFCQLCSLVDGNWADWSSWSSCDVTCDNGKHTRVRSCTNPAPVYRGLDCEGSDTSTKPCIRPLCPVHGGWTEWSDWGACPVTCGPGIQKRGRNCSNPIPLRYGDHCFGDATDDRICIPGLCDKTSSVAFNAYYVTNLKPSINQVLIFSKILVNEGGSYNSSTGIFVAPRNGTYQFNAQICCYIKKYIRFDIMVENVSYAAVFEYDNNAYTCTSTQTIAVLKSGDNVFVRWNYGTMFRDTYHRNTFTGTWIHD